MPKLVEVVKNNMLAGTLVAYILLCLVLGGSSRSWLLAHGVLQVIAAAGIVTLVLSWPSAVRLKYIRTPLAILSGLMIIGLLHCIPLPGSLWGMLPGRPSILAGYENLGVAVTPLPISLDSEATLSSLGYLLTPTFVLLLSVRIGVRKLSDLIPAFLCTAGVLMSLLGLLQVYLGIESGLYLFEYTNFGFPVGTFSNVNHFASFLLMVFPFVIYYLRKIVVRSLNLDVRIALMATISTVAVFLVLGIAVAGSLAAYLVFAPTIGLALLGTHSFATQVRARLGFSVFLLLVVLVSLALFAWGPLVDEFGIRSEADGPTSRQQIWAYTINAIDEYWPVGSGAGTYQGVIPQFEDPDTVTSTYIALAHNEYLQITLELGAPGVLIMLASLVWLVSRVPEIWSNGDKSNANAVRRMAFIAVLVCCAHSIVDYPARTPAVAAIVGFLVALISLPRYNELPPTRPPQKNLKRLVL